MALDIHPSLLQLSASGFIRPLPTADHLAATCGAAPLCAGCPVWLTRHIKHGADKVGTAGKGVGHVARNPAVPVQNGLVVRGPELLC